MLGDTLERFMSSICCRTSHAPQGNRADSQQTSSFSRTQHSLCTAGHDNGQTAEKGLIENKPSIHRVSALATSKTGLGRCSACTDVLIEVGPPGSKLSSTRVGLRNIGTARPRTREQDAILASCLARLQRKRVGPTKQSILAIRPCMGPWRRQWTLGS